MAEEEKKEGEAEGEVKKKSPMLMIIIAVVVVLILGGVGAFFALKGSDKPEGEEGEEEGDEAALPEGDATALGGAVLPLETFIVNLQVKGSFLKTTIQLEFAEPILPPTIESDLPKVRDQIISIMSSKSASDILTTEGKEQLREEIVEGVNEVLGGEDVTRIYFTEFIIQ
jgi:flagellar FliL protein